MAKEKKVSKASKKAPAKPKAAKVPKAPKVNIPKAPANTLNKSGIIAACSIAAEISGKQGNAFYNALTDVSYANLTHIYVWGRIGIATTACLHICKVAIWNLL